MPRDFFDPTPEQQTVVLVNGAMLREAERLIESCEHCNAERIVPSNWLLDRVAAAS